MNFRAVLIAIAASFAATQAANAIPYDEVHPFPQPAPVTDLHKIMLKYKPHLKINEGCHPYPAVQKDGSYSGGLKWTNATDNSECKGSPLGSQVYARSSWVKDKFAIMYAWYFPMGHAPLLPFGHINGWEYAIVWLDSPSPTNSSILGTSLSAAVGWANEVPRKKKYLDGNNLKVAYYFNRDERCTALKYTEEIGEFQAVITWDQLSVPARDSLSNTDWDQQLHVEMPMKDSVFYSKLDSARWRREPQWP